jgi:iron complex outermembrane receptor protein
VATLSSTLPFTPEWQASLGVGYEFALSDNLSLTPRIDVSYTDQQYFDAGNSPEIAQLDAVTLVNGSLVLANEASRWRITLRGDNLTDELYPVAGTSSLTTSSGYAEIIYARPRSFSLSFTADF